MQFVEHNAKIGVDARGSVANSRFERKGEVMLKTVIAAAALSLLALAPAHAAEKAKSTSQHAPSAAQLAQRQRMKDCNAKAGTDKLMGAERKAFMKQCLSNSK